MKSVSPWLCRPALIDGEIFSSFLARIASANGLNPYRFYSFHFPGFPIWNRDIDRSASDKFINDVATCCELDAQVIYTMTLRDFERSLQFPGKKRGSIAPWINAAGIYHRERKGFAMQYCPYCLALSHSYRKIWRLSFVTICEIHQCPLLDSCPHCGMQIVFHRNDVFHPNCHHCGLSLIYLSPLKIGEDELSSRLNIQETLLSALLHGETSITGQITTSQNLFSGLAILMQALKSKIRISRRQGHSLPEVYAKCPTGCIETLRIHDRAQQCLLIGEIFADWPNRFCEFASSQRLTQTSFKNNILPFWLSSIVSELSAGVSRSRHGIIPPVRNQLRSLHRHKLDNWRTERAKLLLKKAGVRI